MKNFFSLCLALVVAAAVSAQTTEDETIRAANDYYNKQQYDQAAAEYGKVLATDADHPVAKFNLANTRVKQNKPAEALKAYTELGTSTAAANEIRGGAYYNKGVVLTSQKKLEESIEAYKNALRQDPQDKIARENLQKALLELKKKNPPKQQDQKQNQKKQEQQQKQQQQPKMSQKETEQRLKLLEQKEKEVQERLQKEKSKTGGGQGKDW